MVGVGLHLIISFHIIPFLVRGAVAYLSRVSLNCNTAYSYMESQGVNKTDDQDSSRLH